MPPYKTPELGDAPEEMQTEADKLYKGLRKDKFHEETPAARESASWVMWSVLKKTWTKDPETGKWSRKKSMENMDYNDGLSSSVTDYGGAMPLIGVGTDPRPDSNYDQEELRLGIETEMEHTADGNIASRIAKDHLDENPRYYSDMKSMEQSMYNMALQSIYDIEQTRKSLVAMKGTGDHLVEYDINKAIEGLDQARTIAEMIVNGGEGSGNFGHEGRPGEVGGSSGGEGSSSSVRDPAFRVSGSRTREAIEKRDKDYMKQRRMKYRGPEDTRTVEEKEDDVIKQYKYMVDQGTIPQSALDEKIKQIESDRESRQKK